MGWLWLSRSDYNTINATWVTDEFKCRIDQLNRQTLRTRQSSCDRFWSCGE
jgi:hypothetical protein